MADDKPYLKKLSRRWLRARGPDALRFLNGMWTSDMKRGVNDLGTGLGFLLTAKGKSITEARFFNEGSDSILLAIPEENYAATFAALDHYKVADDFEWEESAAINFTQAYEVLNAPSVNHFEIVPNTPAAHDKVFRAIAQPWGLRLPIQRLAPGHEEWWVTPDPTEPPAPNSQTEAEVDSPSALAAFVTARIDAGSPEWAVDIQADALPLEFPIFDAISFAKGCYIGQEVVARATYRGQMPRAFCRFTSADRSTLTTGLIHNAADPERPVGKITTASGNRGLGLLRLAALAAGIDPLYVINATTGEKISLTNVEDLLPEKVGL